MRAGIEYPRQDPYVSDVSVSCNVSERFYTTDVSLNNERTASVTYFYEHI